MENRQGTALSRKEIITHVQKFFDIPGTSILPSDHCFGRETKGRCDHCQNPAETIFKRISYGHYLVVIRDQEAEIISDLQDIQDDKTTSETEKLALIKARVGQGSFRNDLMEKWDRVCSVTGCDQPEILRASHIKPWKESSNEERLSPYNGLLLSANLDALFDKYLVSFTDGGEMLVSPAVTDETRRMLNLPLNLGIKLTEKELNFLKFHRDRFLKKCQSLSAQLGE